MERDFWAGLIWGVAGALLLLLVSVLVFVERPAPAPEACARVEVDGEVWALPPRRGAGAVTGLQAALAETLERAAAAPGCRVLVSGAGFAVWLGEGGRVFSSLVVPAASRVGSAGWRVAPACAGPWGSLREAAEGLERALAGEARLFDDLGLGRLLASRAVMR